MNRFAVACRAFAEGLSSTPSVTDTREAMISATKADIRNAEHAVQRINADLDAAKKRVAVLNTKLEQLNALSDEAFSVLVS